VSCWGSLADNEMIKEIGKTFVFSIDIESREYNNKWYTDVKAWKIEVEITNENKKIIDLTEYEDDPF
jgi:hypothetical protein